MLSATGGPTRGPASLPAIYSATNLHRFIVPGAGWE